MHKAEGFKAYESLLHKRCQEGSLHSTAVEGANRREVIINIDTYFRIVEEALLLSNLQ